MNSEHKPDGLNAFRVHIQMERRNAIMGNNNNKWRRQKRSDYNCTGEEEATETQHIAPDICNIFY